MAAVQSVKRGRWREKCELLMQRTWLLREMVWFVGGETIRLMVTAVQVSNDNRRYKRYRLPMTYVRSWPIASSYRKHKNETEKD